MDKLIKLKYEIILSKVAQIKNQKLMQTKYYGYIIVTIVGILMIYYSMWIYLKVRLYI